MRRASLIFAVIIIAECLFATGQRGGVGGYQQTGDMANAYLNWLNQQLNLTQDQTEKLRPILIEEGQQIKAVRQEISLSPEQKQGKLEETHKTFVPRINAVLTPEQQEKYKQLKREARERHEDEVRSEAVQKH